MLTVRSRVRIAVFSALVLVALSVGATSALAAPVEPILICSPSFKSR